MSPPWLIDANKAEWSTSGPEAEAAGGGPDGGGGNGAAGAAGGGGGGGPPPDDAFGFGAIGGRVPDGLAGVP